MATRIWESTIVDAPINVVWELVRPLNFSYNPAVASSAIEGKASANEVGSMRAVTYKDKTVQKLRLTELSDSKHTVSWDLHESIPATHVMSASYSIRLRPITQGNLTFVEWIADFSKDLSANASLDATYKARENFKALAATAKAKVAELAASAKLGKNKVSVPELKRQLSAKSAQLHKLFAELDKNGNGVLEFDEFALAVNKLYGENLPDEGIRLLLRSADTNNDQVVSYDEFVKFLAAEGLESKASNIDSKSLPPITLHYFNARGRGEVARLLMAEAGVKYTDQRWDFKDFTEKLKPKAPFGQLPVLEVGGKFIAQSQAINRYLAKLAGLLGKTPEDTARIDMISELFYSDIGGAWSSAWYEKDAKLKEEKVAKFLGETLPAQLALAEKQLAALPRGSPYYLGHTFSLADIIIFDAVTKFMAKKPDVANATPLLHQLVTRVGSRPNIAAWVKARPVTDS